MSGFVQTTSTLYEQRACTSTFARVRISSQDFEPGSRVKILSQDLESGFRVRISSHDLEPGSRVIILIQDLESGLESVFRASERAGRATVTKNG